MFAYICALIMTAAKKNIQKFKSKLTKKFRLVVLNEESFEERFSFKLTRLNVFVLGGVFSILLVTLTVLLIAFTPIKVYIPGFSSSQLKRQASQLFYRADSLQMQLNTLKNFTDALRPILVGEEASLDPLPLTEKAFVNLPKAYRIADNDSLNQVLQNIRKEMDSTFRSHYQKEKKVWLKRNREIQQSLIAENDSLVQEWTQKYALLLREKEALQKDVPENAQRGSQTAMSSLFEQREEKLKANYETKVAQLQNRLLSKETEVDSLKRQLEEKQRKIGQISDEMPFAEVDPSEHTLLTPSKRDSLFRIMVEREDLFSLVDFEGNREDNVFFAPVKGIVTARYDVKDKHYAVDIAVSKRAAVKAVADGTVVFSDWTPGTGYVMIVEHTNKYLSVYKHNETTFREQGDLVQSGEVIALAGTTGEYSTGTHLHFEMWFQGRPVNPENYIEFE